MRWWRTPFWLLSLLTGAKSFADNPILGSQRLNRAGLHVFRLKMAHAMARMRRARLAKLIPDELREQFERDGFIVIRNVLPDDTFRHLQSSILGAELECREHQQGDTVTRRSPVGPVLRRRFPQLAALLDSPRWKGVMAYVGSTRSAPLYYIQTIAAGVAEGPPDPQLELHSDTFHPSLKAWLFLTDVHDDGRPLTYVAGSHRLTDQRAAWEHRKSVGIMADDNHLSRRGSLRVSLEELPGLGLPPPTRFCVPANTLVAIDTCGFHARADSDRPTVRVELWAYCRRTPFLPWTGGDPLSWPPIAARRAQWLGSAVDWLARRGWATQHWRTAGRRRPLEP
ncbi:MAG: phytanoyl-CoA dioxygenase family protein [Pseudomonadota bacterium]|nr:phytanoyl-CoA dioxygenase family protein [Pseudomonadota bacterium]